MSIPHCPYGFELGSLVRAAPGVPAHCSSLLIWSVGLLAFSASAVAQSNVVTWGDNTYGQCNVPTLPPGLSHVETAVGNLHTVARRSDGSVVAWGDNSYGQSNLPALPAGFTYVEIATGYAHTVVRMAPSPPCGSVSSYCGPAASNSAFTAGARFAVGGCPGLTSNDLVFEVSGLPPQKLGMFIYGLQQRHVPLGNGWLCIGGNVQRVSPALHASPTGSVSHPINLTSSPLGSRQNAILAGSCWNFQYWFRDPAGGGSGSNLSDAKHILFAP